LFSDSSCAVGVSGNVVPNTYKQKKAAIAAPPKIGDGDEKAAGEAPAEGQAEETPAGMGRGSR